MAYDVKLKQETWLFEQVGTASDGTPLYRRLKWNLVRYDNSPDEELEPVNNDEWVDSTGRTEEVLRHQQDDDTAAATQHKALVRGFRFVTGPINGVHSFDTLQAV